MYAHAQLDAPAFLAFHSHSQKHARQNRTRPALIRHGCPHLHLSMARLQIVQAIGTAIAFLKFQF
jgi:hypothetical protein